MDVIERVENAIARHLGSASLASGEAREAAREVIFAMYEPTEAMIDAGYIHLTGERFQRPREPINAWRAMIDAALKSHAKPA